MALGIKRPYVALAGVVWIDLYKPQLLSQSFLLEKPLSLLMVAFFFMVAGINLNKMRIPSKTSYILVVPAFLFWITLSTIHAQFPAAAWVKHDIAFKTILFAYFIPFVLSERKDIELFIWVVVGSLGSYMVTAGTKSILGGGGYGVNLVNDHPGMTWNEGSTLAAQAISLIPILFFACTKTMLAEKYPSLKKVTIGMAFFALMVLVGTQARTGLVALAVLILMSMRYSKSKFKIFAATVCVPLIAFPFLPSAWFERMSTLSDTKQESSAHGRIVVWRWTFDYVADRPFLGGGFHAYLANEGVLKDYSKEGEVEIEHKGGKAFHNIFIEVLGEHGYVGLFLFVTIIGQTLLTARKISRSEAAHPWQQSLGLCILISVSVYCVGGMFIGVAFYPWIYHMYGLTIALNNSMATNAKRTPRRALRNEQTKQLGER